MPKSDNPRAINLYESMKKHINEEAAEQLIEQYPLSKSADIDKKFRWAKNVCEKLDNEYDHETVMAVRMDCACGPEYGKIEKLKKLYETAGSIEAFVERANKLNQGFTIEYTDGSLYLIYPQCYCSCVKRINEVLPESWCYCTLGYTKKMFGNILSKDVSVELCKSVKMGDDVCRIRISGF